MKFALRIRDLLLLKYLYTCFLKFPLSQKNGFFFFSQCIYGCYVHSAILPTFHRRCYWLLQNPDIVLVHYLNVPYPDDNKLVIASSVSLWSEKKEWTKEELISQLKPMCEFLRLRKRLISAAMLQKKLLPNRKCNNGNKCRYSEISALMAQISGGKGN